MTTAGALAGMRVVELASAHAAFAGKLLADLGAEVVVVEPPGGHASRGYEPFLDDVPDAERSLWWWTYNTGKLGVTLDVDSDADRLRALLASADVVLEGEPPGRLAAAGLDYADLEAPQVVWVSVTPFGRGNPRAHEPVTDLTILAGAGPVWSCGYDDHTLPPVRPGGNQAFHTASIWAVMGALTALLVRETLGSGQLIDVSMHAASNVTTEAATYEWLVAQATVQRQTCRHAAVKPTQPRLATCADGRHVIGALPRTADEFRAVLEWITSLGVRAEIDEVPLLELAIERGGVTLPEIGRDPLATELYQAGRDALLRIADRVTGDEFFVGSQRRGLPAGVVWGPADIAGDEHFRAHGFPVEIWHEDLGRSFVYAGAPFRATVMAWPAPTRAPHIGEHNSSVLG